MFDKFRKVRGAGVKGAESEFAKLTGVQQESAGAGRLDVNFPADGETQARCHAFGTALALMPASQVRDDSQIRDREQYQHHQVYNHDLISSRTDICYQCCR